MVVGDDELAMSFGDARHVVTPLDTYAGNDPEPASTAIGYPAHLDVLCRHPLRPLRKLRPGSG